MEPKLCPGGQHHHGDYSDHMMYSFHYNLILQVVFFGFLVGGPVWGIAADKFGRKKVS